MDERKHIPERNPVADAVSTIAWALMILHLDFNIWRLNILGNWIGYWMIASAVKKLGEENPEFALLESLAIGLAVWDGVCNGLWLFFGMAVNIYAATIIELVLVLYLRFQLFTNLAEIAESHGCPQRKPLLVLRTVQTLLVTAGMLLPSFAEGMLSHELSLDWDPVNMLLFVPEKFDRFLYVSNAVLKYGNLAANAVVAVWILVLLFSLRKSLGWTPPPRNPKPPEVPPLDTMRNL